MACIRNAEVGLAGTREQALDVMQKMVDDNIRWVYHEHRQKKWLKERADMDGGVICPGVRRYMRLITQEYHRRGLA